MKHNEPLVSNIELREATLEYDTAKSLSDADIPNEYDIDEYVQFLQNALVHARQKLGIWGWTP